MAPGSIAISTLLLACTGTALCSASANTFNQVRRDRTMATILLDSWVQVYNALIRTLL